MKALLQLVSQYSIRVEAAPNALFLEDDRYIGVAGGKYAGFLLFCTEHDHPGRLSERQDKQHLLPGKKIPPGCYFVGECRWLWSKDDKDIIGVTLRTDVEVGGGNRYGNEYDDLRRLEQQNRPEDVVWAKQKIDWLWEQTFHGKIQPEIILAEKFRVHSWEDYIDHGDYM